MAVIANLDVLLSANTRKFDAGMSKSQKRVAAFSKASIGMGVALGGAILATNRLRKEFEDMDVVGKLSGRIGETTENISRLGHAAVITGASAEQMNAGLDVMQKRLGEAAMGSGEARAALDELGLEVDDLIAMGPAAAFNAIADAVSGLDDQATKAAVTSKIFSRANQELVNTLDLGSKGLAEMAAESDKLGITLSSSAAASAAEAADAMSKLDGVFTGLKRTFATFAAPAFTKFFEDLSGALATIKNIDAALRDFNKTPEGDLRKELTAAQRHSLREGRPIFDRADVVPGRPATPEPAQAPAVVPGSLYGGSVTRFGPPATEDTNKRQEEILRLQLAEQRRTNTELRRRPGLSPAPL